jgi:AraC-like DNA-binding protein
VSQNSKVPDPELVDREIKVLELRRAGLTWQRISEETGYADASGAYLAYKRAIKRTMQQPADELREQELDRIDRLQLALWPKAMKGDNASINTIIRLMERRARLLGLDTPIKIQQDVVNWDGNESIDRAVRELAALLTANDAISISESPMAIEASEIEPITAGDELEELADPIGSGLGQDEDRLGMDSLESPEQPKDEMGNSSGN